MNYIERTLLALVLLVPAFSITYAQPPQNAKEFIDQVSMRSMAIIGAAEIALDITRSQEVKAFAQKIISEYEPIMESVNELAKSENIEIADKHELKETAKKLMIQERDQKSFDVAYANNQLPAIRQMILMFQDAADSTEYDVRNFAVSTLPQLRRHLLMAEQLYAGTAETRTDIYHDRDNQLDSDNPDIDEEQNRRIPATDRLYP